MKKSLFDKLIALLKLEPAERSAILDIGCGRGELLRMVQPSLSHDSRLVGIDAGLSSIVDAQAQHPSGEYFQHKFEQHLPFADEQFDFVLSVDLLEAIVDKAALVQEMARVLKPNGTVLCAHWDWDTAVYASAQTELIRRCVHAFADWQQGWMDSCDGLMGRKLWGLFQRSQHFSGRMDTFTLVETDYKPGCYGYDRLQDIKSLAGRGQISLVDYQRIHQEMSDLAERGEYFYSLNSYLYIGQKRG